MVSLLSVNIRLMNFLVFLVSVYPVLSWRPSRYRSFGEISEYDPLARGSAMGDDEVAATLRLAENLALKEVKPVIPEFVSPFERYQVRKRDDKLKRCGKVLIKFVMEVCDFCITPSGTKQVNVESRRRKRGADDMDEITEACCKRPCSAADVSVFCCASSK